MTSLSKNLYILLMLALVLALSGCELAREGSDAGDTSPVQALPPTLAPLGSEDSPLVTEATAMPTVLSAPATATVGAPAVSSAANPVELVAPTAQVVEAAPAPAGDAAAAAEATTAPSIIVSAPAPDQLPEGGPVAVNPPAAGTNQVIPAASTGGTYTVEAGDTLFAISQRYDTTVEAIVAANSLTSDMVQIGQTLTIPADSVAAVDPSAPAASAPAMPAAPVAPAAPMDAGGAYVVTANDTLFGIAQRYGTTVEAIAGANNISYPYIIYDGQTLTVPAAGAAPTYPQQPQQGYYDPNQAPQQGYYDPNQAYPPQPQQGYYDPNQAYPPQPQQGYDPNQAYPPQPVPAVPMTPNGGTTHTVAAGDTLYSIARQYGVPAQAIAAANNLTDPNQLFIGQMLYLP